MRKFKEINYKLHSFHQMTIVERSKKKNIIYVITSIKQELFVLFVNLIFVLIVFLE